VWSTKFQGDIIGLHHHCDLIARGRFPVALRTLNNGREFERTLDFALDWVPFGILRLKTEAGMDLFATKSVGSILSGGEVLLLLCR